MEKVLAIDGPAASGKSTLAAAVAGALGIPYVNTGSLYRAVALLAGGKCNPVPPEVLRNLDLSYQRDDDGNWSLRINGRDPGAKLRTPEIAAAASLVATQPAVRQALLELQRELGRRGWLVMEGRDIATVVFPEARFKFFVTASPEERARRRLAQSGETVAGATLEEVAAAIRARDEQDANRKVAPLKPAPDSIVLDSTGKSSAQMLEEVLKIAGNEICITK